MKEEYLGALNSRTRGILQYTEVVGKERAALRNCSLGIGEVQLFKVTRLTTRLPALEGARWRFRTFFDNLLPTCRLITCVRSWLQERIRQLALKTGDVGVVELVPKG